MAFLFSILWLQSIRRVKGECNHPSNLLLFPFSMSFVFFFFYFHHPNHLTFLLLPFFLYILYFFYFYWDSSWLGESRCPLLSSSLSSIFYGRLLWTTRTRKSFVTGAGLSTDFEITDRQQKLVSSSPLFSIDVRHASWPEVPFFFFSLSLS